MSNVAELVLHKAMERLCYLLTIRDTPNLPIRRQLVFGNTANDYTKYMPKAMKFPSLQSEGYNLIARHALKLTSKKIEAKSISYEAFVVVEVRVPSELSLPSNGMLVSA